MAQYKLLPVPAENYDALGIEPDTVLEFQVTDNCTLIVRKVAESTLEEFVCDGDCQSCPVATIECDGDCFSCPCYACCDNSNYNRPEGVCKSKGTRIN